MVDWERYIGFWTLGRRIEMDSENKIVETDSTVLTLDNGRYSSQAFSAFSALKRL